MKKQKEPTEQELKAQAEKKRLERESKLIIELTEWCNKNNCRILPAIDIIINGQPLGVMLKAL